jgi:hypothetical protein
LRFPPDFVFTALGSCELDTCASPLSLRHTEDGREEKQSSLGESSVKIEMLP